MKRLLPFVLPLLLAGCAGIQGGVGTAFDVTPKRVTLPPGGTQTIEVHQAEYSLQEYNFSLREGADGGTLTLVESGDLPNPAARLYTAPSTLGTYHVLAGFTESTGEKHSQTVTIVVAGQTQR